MVLIDLGEDILFAEIHSAATALDYTNSSSSSSELLSPAETSEEVATVENNRQPTTVVDVTLYTADDLVAQSNHLIVETTTISTIISSTITTTTTMGNHGTKTHPLTTSSTAYNSQFKGSCSHSVADPSNNSNNMTLLDTTATTTTTSNKKRVIVTSSIPLLTTASNNNTEGGGGLVEQQVKKRGPRETPDLYVYASYRNWELAKKQIELNRGLEYISTNRRFSVLHVAVENNAPVEVIKMLLDKGMDPNVVDTLFRQSPLHILMKILNDGGNAFEIMRALIENGANVNAQAKYGRTPLYCAIKYRVSESSVVFLLKSGALISQEELIFAREKASRSMALLLEKVSIMTAICSSHLQRCTRARRDGTIVLGRSTHLSTLPVELFRELKRYLYR